MILQQPTTQQLDAFASPHIASMRRVWWQLDGSSAFRTATQAGDMYSTYNYAHLPPFHPPTPMSTQQPHHHDYSILSNEIIQRISPSFPQHNAPSINMTPHFTPETPPSLVQLFSMCAFWGAPNGICHYWLNNTYGPLQRYMPTNEFYLFPFYHDQQECITWFALADIKVRDGSIGSALNPCVVSGINSEQIEADDYFSTNALNLNDLHFVSPSIEEFLWRNYLEDQIVHELFVHQTPIQDLSGEMADYVNHYRNL
ncbi:hypothetical protein C9374_003453 [Naegleria lovaniensis]|uniref:Uncharacterized protein n=1 Tax=Naegleria lovaniensis TaxID=51637 RepID=A0AA88GSV2_NAELO|nr:uncharacterized protein C9374_003453 [Naegleria lovaniensis]KAG2385638.1 hypothetical protein C9374_003453 [Naegleria lovaniensis]